MASRAGKSRGSREVATLKAEVRDLIGKVEGEEVSATRGNTMLRGYAVLKDFIELERKVKETEELEERIAALERREPNEGGRRYGA